METQSLILLQESQETMERHCVPISRQPLRWPKEYQLDMTQAALLAIIILSTKEARISKGVPAQLTRGRRVEMEADKNRELL